MMDDYSAQQQRFKVNLTTASEPVIRWFSSYANGAVTLTQEVGRFVGERTQRNVETFLAMSSNAGNPSRLMEQHEKWYWGAMRDYTDETQRLLSISGEIMSAMFDKTAQVTTMVPGQKKG
jgi:hypothetical protein